MSQKSASLKKFFKRRTKKMKGSKNYVAPEMFTFCMSEDDVVRTSQVDVYTNDSYTDGWTDGSLKN